MKISKYKTTQSKKQHPRGCKHNGKMKRISHWRQDGGRSGKVSWEKDVKSKYNVHIQNWKKLRASQRGCLVEKAASV